jgi:hypothetical protein
LKSAAQGPLGAQVSEQATRTAQEQRPCEKLARLAEIAAQEVMAILAAALAMDRKMSQNLSPLLVVALPRSTR